MTESAKRVQKYVTNATIIQIPKVARPMLCERLIVIRLAGVYVNMISGAAKITGL